jgi:hypothetical protein
MDDTIEEGDSRLVLYATGFVLEGFNERFGNDIQPLEVRHRCKSAATIITSQIGHDGCIAMEGYEVQDLLCRLSGLFAELQQSMRRLDAKNAAGICGMLATRLGGFCGRAGGGDRRGHKQQVTHTAAYKPPKMGR